MMTMFLPFMANLRKSGLCPPTLLNGESVVSARCGHFEESVAKVLDNDGTSLRAEISAGKKVIELLKVSS